MTHQQWLNIALDGLAPNTRQRLWREYEAHMLDMQEAGEPDWAIAAALGDPVQLNRELKEKYLTEWEVGVLQSRSRLWTSWAVWTPLVQAGLGVLVLWLLTRILGGKPWQLWWLPLLVGMLGTLWLLYLRRTLPESRLKLTGATSVSFLSVLIMWAFQSVNPWDWITALSFLVGWLVALGFYRFGLNGKLYQKLAIEDAFAAATYPVNTPHSR